MIIKGTARTGPDVLGKYLGNADKNERIEVLEVKGTLAQDLVGALVEMDAYAEGTKCEKPLYHSMISPEPPFRLTPEQRESAIDALEKKLGLEGHARVVVLHEKLGREHIHVVWTRIDLEGMRAVSDSHNYRKHEEVARDLERRFDHPHVQGAHAEREGAERPDRSPSRAELRQQERTGIKGQEVRAEVTAAFRASDSAEAFKAALEAKGYVLAQGDRRDFVIVDRAGGVHSLARRIEDVKAAELREFMKPVDRAALPKAEQAKEAQFDRQQGRLSLLDQAEWNNALSKNAIEKDKKAEAQQRQQDRASRKARREARRDDMVERGYASGGDFGSQTQAAQRDVKRRSKLRGHQPSHPSQHRGPKIVREFDDNGTLVAPRAAGPSAEANDKAIGQIVDRTDCNKVANERHAKANEAIYGPGGHDSSEQKKVGTERSRRKKEERQNWGHHPDVADKPFAKERTGKDLRKTAEQRYRNNERILYESGYDGKEPDNAPPGKSLYERMKAGGASLPLVERTDGTSLYERLKAKRGGTIELSDKLSRELDRETANRLEGERWIDRDPDRQNEAPGGGRTRSR
jgi:hypothetical protein